jgi:hypothetical protein
MQSNPTPVWLYFLALVAWKSKGVYFAFKSTLR